MITYYKSSLKLPELKEIEKFEKGCWINVTNPTEEEISILEKEYDLYRQNILAGLDKNEIPRFEVDEGQTYIITKTVSYSNKNDLQTLLIVITDNFILTLSNQKTRFADDIILGKKRFTTTQKLKSLIIILSKINKDFEDTTLKIVRSVNSKKSSINELSEKDINTLLENESILNNFVSNYFYISRVYNQTLKNIKFFEEDKDIIEDMVIDTKQGQELCQSALTTISNIRNHYVIILSNKLNKVITLLTIFTVMISIPAAISGLYGMNLVLPLQNSRYMFGAIVAFIIVIWTVLLIYFRKQKLF